MQRTQLTSFKSNGRQLLPSTSWHMRYMDLKLTQVEGVPEHAHSTDVLQKVWLMCAQLCQSTSPTVSCLRPGACVSPEHGSRPAKPSGRTVCTQSGTHGIRWGRERWMICMAVFHKSTRWNLICASMSSRQKRQTSKQHNQTGKSLVALLRRPCSFFGRNSSATLDEDVLSSSGSMELGMGELH